MEEEEGSSRQKDLYEPRHGCRTELALSVPMPMAILVGHTEIRHWLPLSSGIRGKSISPSSCAVFSKLYK